MSLAARPHVPGVVRGRRTRVGALKGLIALGIVAWIAVGLLGVGRYVHNYVLYRGFPPPITPKGVPTGRVETLKFFSPALHSTSSALVYLPPSYASAAASGQRFPVLYLLHGTPGTAQNMFLAGAAGRDANVLIDRHRITPMILVAPAGKSGFSSATEWADGRYGAYGRYMLDVVRAVDTHLATIPDRAHRVIAGDSEGAFGAANLALHDLSVFSGFQSWSGYFTEHPTGTFKGAPPAVIAANSPATYVSQLSAQLRRLPLHAFVYQGKKDRSDAARQGAFVAALQASGVRAAGGLYRGGHDWGLWRAQMPHMLRLASSWMSAPHKTPTNTTSPGRNG
jgi:enterochelin esterase-like enzyme